MRMGIPQLVGKTDNRGGSITVKGEREVKKDRTSIASISFYTRVRIFPTGGVLAMRNGH